MGGDFGVHFGVKRGCIGALGGEEGGLIGFCVTAMGWELWGGFGGENGLDWGLGRGRGLHWVLCDSNGLGVLGGGFWGPFWGEKGLNWGFLMGGGGGRIVAPLGFVSVMDWGLFGMKKG